MALPYGFRKEIADALFEQFPEAPTKTLARIAYRDNKGIWKNIDAARSYFRYLRGNHGGDQRKALTDKSHIRKNRVSGDPFTRLPEPLSDFEDWQPIEFAGPLRVLGLMDVHIPFYDKTATVTALKEGKKLNPNFVLLGGDICDHHAESDYIKDPRSRDFPGEIRAMLDFLRVVRDLFPKAQIVYKLGNHEERHIRYMRLKAPELLGIKKFEFESIMELADNDIQMVGDNRPIRLGKLNFIHGHEYKFSISNPVNPARGLFLRGISNACCGHFHQTSQHTKRSLEQKVISNWSAGCLSNLHPEWRPLNDWNHGFLLIEVDKDGAFEVGNMRVLHGRAYY